MSKCDLTIELDQDRLKPGETLTGRLNLEVNSKCRCDGLILRCQWQTHGRGNRATGVAEEQILFKGDLAAGEAKVVPFSFQIPYGPLTKRGDYLNVDWYVYAQVDIPWAIDPHTEEEFVVELPEHPCVLSLGDQHPFAEILADHAGCELGEAALSLEEAAQQALLEGDLDASTAGCAVGVILAFGAVFSAFWVPSWMDLGWLGFPIAMFPPLMFAIVIFMLVRNTVAQRKIGEVTLALQPSPILSPGTSLTATASFCPPGAVQLNKVVMSLEGVERVVSGSGTNKTTHTNAIYSEEIEVTGPRSLMAGSTQLFQAEFRLPEDAPTSFVAGSNALNWQLGVHVDIPLWPDYQKDFTLTVYPWPLNSETAALNKDLTGGGSKPKPTSERPAPSIEPRPMPTAGPSETPESPGDLAPHDRVGDAQDLVLLVEELSQATFSSDRELILQQAKNRHFSLELTIEENNSSSSFDVSERLKNGLTLVGTIKGSDLSAEIRFPESQNDELNSLGRGDTVSVSTTLAGWKTLYDRPQLDAV